MNCEFCKNSEIDSRVIIENELAKAFPSIQPIVPGHILIIPKRHIQRFEELNEKERGSIFDLMDKVKKALIKTFEAEGFNIAWNENEIAGQSVPHFHLHIVPRKGGDKGIYEYEPRKFLYRPGSRADSPLNELLEVTKIIKKNIDIS